MDDTIKIKGGSGETPELQNRELGYNKTEMVLYIGTLDGNVRLCGAKDIDNIKNYIDRLITEANENADDIATEAKEYADSLIDEERNYIETLMVEVNRRLTALETPVEPEPEPEEPETPEEGEVNG